MNKILLLLVAMLLFVLPSCSLFSPSDTTPAILAVNQMEDIGVNALDTVKELVNNATGLDPTQKAAILSKVSVETKKLTDLQTALASLLESYGDVDWKVLAKEAYDLYVKLREEK